MNPHTISAIDQGFQVAKRVLEAEVWMVRYLGNVVGPISLGLVEKGIAAGKLPRGTEIAHWEEQRWRRLQELYPELEMAPSGDAEEGTPTPRRPEPSTTMISDAPAVANDSNRVYVGQTGNAPIEEAALAPLDQPSDRPSSMPPPAPPRSARVPFSARAFSSPPPRPIPVPASAPPVAPAMVHGVQPLPVSPDRDELPVVPPPPPVPPEPPPSYRFPEEPVSIPKQGVLAALFG